MSYLDEFLKEQNGDQHAKQFSCYPRELSDDCAGVEHSEKNE